MGAYLAWLARDYEQRQAHLRHRVGELRNCVQEDSSLVHARLPGIIAELHGSWELWLQFAGEVGAIQAAERIELEQRGKRALREVAALQSCYHQPSDPALRFLSLVRT